jgi:DNA-binding NtrC family response regulator
MVDGRTLILVVDDEDQLAHLASVFLRRAGYQTLKANSAAEARDSWRPEVDLLLTDCAMPDSWGDQLAVQLLEKKPNLKVLFMSGNSPETIEASLPLRPGINFIQKPFMAGELLALISQALNSELAVLSR